MKNIETKYFQSRANKDTTVSKGKYAFISSKRQQIIFLLIFVFIALMSYSQSSTSYIPAGTVVATTSTSVPAGWLLCDGTTYAVSTYPALSAVIGIAFGGTNGVNFKVPDMRGRFARGANVGQANPNAPASTIGQFQDDLIADHSHASGTLNAVTISNGNHQHIHNHENVTASGSATITHLHTLTLTSGTTSANHSHNTTTNSVTHTHGFLQWTTGTNNYYIAGSDNSLVWSGTSNIDMVSNTAAGGHNHTIGNSSVNHTHAISGSTNNNSSATHRHTISLAQITSNAGGAHTHNLSGNTANSSNGSATTDDTRPDNISMNFIIKY